MQSAIQAASFICGQSQATIESLVFVRRLSGLKIASKTRTERRAQRADFQVDDDSAQIYHAMS